MSDKYRPSDTFIYYAANSVMSEKITANINNKIVTRQRQPFSSTPQVSNIHPHVFLIQVNILLEIYSLTRMHVLGFTLFTGHEGL
jgi:uncharacterized Zn-finger protein